MSTDEIQMAEEQAAQGKSQRKTPKRSAPAGPRQPRKRTKTGCLTCRKRRIKCGEERPTCLNCHKSRRECEGYRPPIVFRRSHLHSGQSSVSLAPLSDHNNPYVNNYTSPLDSLGHETFPGWSSVPPEWGHTTGPERSAGFSPAMLQTPQQVGPALSSQLAFNAFADAEYEHTPSQFFEAADMWQLPTSNGPSKHGFSTHSVAPQDHTPGITPISQDETLSLFHETAQDPSLYGQEPYRPDSKGGYDTSHTFSADYPSASIVAANSTPTPPSTFPFHIPYASLGHSAASDYAGASNGSLHLQAPPHTGSVSNASIATLGNPLATSNSNHHLPATFFGQPGSSQILDAAAVPTQDDDYWDLASDRDSDASDGESPFDPNSLDRDYHMITSITKSGMALAISNLMDASAYTYPGFSLDTYRPEHTANPLRNPYTQSVFAHFVFSTGPLISYLQQRNRISLSSASAPGPIASSPQGLWTYTLATMALHNQALLHAMLAMASLHMAKLQNASITPSLKHYSYSLRRVHRDVQHDRKRHEVPTLAATLLLAFYEIMQADHRKWSTHLVGAKQLISEIDFAGMTAQVESLKSAATTATQSQSQSLTNRAGTGIESNTVAQLFPSCDHQLLSKLMGKPYDQSAHTGSKKQSPAASSTQKLNATELRNFQILQDLFWWNCRHDIIHAIVGGNPLLLDYDKWNSCQPRAPAGQADAVHGSFDHLMLLLGRVANFMNKDRPRKIRASAAFSASPKQPTAMDGEHGSAAGIGQQKMPPMPPMPPGPGFFGMAPSSGPGPLPRAFQNPNAQYPSSPSPGAASPESNAAMELETATALAIAEWNDIHSAFTAFADSLGPSFQPLADDEYTPFKTPFGAAVLFKSYAIAALWAWYYCGLIITLRCHPKMPAPATVAVGAAAKQTAKYANQVGRIVYCITSDFLTPPLDPSSAGAFSEASLPLFFAGVQYQDDTQRKWTISRLREIESLTGWATIGLCASGCEGAWVKAHEMGRGPKYVRCTGIERGAGSIVVSEEEQEEMGPLPSSTASRDGSPNASAGAKSKLSEHERRFMPFYRGSQVMWAYQLYSTTLDDDLACMPLVMDVA